MSCNTGVAHGSLGLKTFFTTLTTYCKKIAIFLRKFKDSLMFIMQAI